MRPIATARGGTSRCRRAFAGVLLSACVAAVLACPADAQENTGSESSKFTGKMRVAKEKLKSLATGEVIAQTDVVYVEGQRGYVSYKDIPSSDEKTDRYIDYQDLRVHVVRADPAHPDSFDIEGKDVRLVHDFATGKIVLIGGSNARLTMAKGVRAIRLQGVLIRRDTEVDAPDSYVTWSRQEGISAVGNGYVVGKAVEAETALSANLLPKHSAELVGKREVRITNPNEFAVLAGIRSGERGTNLTVPANGRRSAYVPDGQYDIFFVYSSKPDALFQGDSFTLKGNGVEIKIVKVVGGNYGIRQVK